MGSQSNDQYQSTKNFILPGEESQTISSRAIDNDPLNLVRANKNDPFAYCLSFRRAVGSVATQCSMAETWPTNDLSQFGSFLLGNGLSASWRSLLWIIMVCL